MALLLSAVVVCAPSSADDEWNVYWKNGTRVESADGKTKLKFGGRLMADYSFVDADSTLERAFDFSSGSEFRRARLYSSGTIGERFDFKAQFDFANSDVQVKDVYLGLNKIPFLGGIRVGHFKEPYGLEQLTSSNHIPFLERAFVGEPGRNMGFMFHNQVQDQRLTWAVGMFQDTDNSGTSRGSEWNTTARLTGLPIYADDGRRLFHLGVGASQRNPVDNTFRLRDRPGSHISPRLIDTGSIATEGIDLLGLEAAVVMGRFWAQAETSSVSYDRPSDGDLSVSYIQAGVFLTGEHRAYKKSAGAFDRLKPQSDFLDGGIGAFELAARYMTSDYEDGTIRGGEQTGYTFGLNWYPNSAIRLMLNYISTDLEDVGTVEFVTIRFKVDF